MSLLHRSRALLLLSVALLTSLVVAPAVGAQEARVSGGTTLTLEPEASEALEGLDITASRLRPARAVEGDLRFPLTALRINQRADRISIRHTGGIALRRGDTTVSLRNFFVTAVNRRAALTAVVDGGERITLLRLDPRGAQVTQRRNRVTILNLRGVVTDEAADALNTALDVTAFEDGLVLGTLDTTARFSQAGRRGGNVRFTG